jgi:hypothetical protein
MLRSRPTDVDISVVPWATQFRYKTYVGMLPHFMAAYCHQKKIKATDSFLPCSLTLKDSFPRPVPPIVISFNRPIMSEQSDYMKSIGYEEGNFKGKKYLCFPRLQIDQLRMILSFGPNQITPSPNGSINVSAFSTISLVTRVFSNFLLAHQYPAFQTPEHVSRLDDVEGLKGTFVEWKAGEEKKRKRGGKEKGPPRKRTAAEEQEEGEVSMNLSDSDEDSDPGAEVDITKDVIFAAYPPPLDCAGWGDADSIPNYDGIYVPFISELAAMDSKAVPRVIRQFFLPCLGHSVESIRESMARIESDFGVIMHTRAGDMYAHIAVCIETAIAAQARPYLIFEDERYEGCVLLGAGYTIHVKGQSYVPVAYPILLERVKSLGSHLAAVGAIAKVCAKEIDEIYTVGDENRKIDSMYEFSRVVGQIGLTEESRDSVRKFAIKLSFGSEWTMTFPNILKALELISSTEPLPRDLPIHHSAFFSTDRVELVLSCFGSSAPSCIYAASPRIDMTRKQNISQVQFSQLPLERAIVDMKSVISTKSFSLPAQRLRSGSYKQMQFKGKQATDLYAGLCKVSGSAVSVEPVRNSNIAGPSSSIGFDMFEI